MYIESLQITSFAGISGYELSLSDGVNIVRGDNEDIASFADLAGKKTANSIASTYMTLAESYGAEAVGVDTHGYAGGAVAVHVDLGGKVTAVYEVEAISLADIFVCIV